MFQTYMSRQDDGVGEGSYDSIAWLFTEHIHEPDTLEFNFAVLYGNEDAPEKIELWRSEPLFDAPADRVWKANS